jgi:hypothetical protein
LLKQGKNPRVQAAGKPGGDQQSAANNSPDSASFHPDSMRFNEAEKPTELVVGSSTRGRAGAGNTRGFQLTVQISP